MLLSVQPQPYPCESNSVVSLMAEFYVYLRLCPHKSCILIVIVHSLFYRILDILDVGIQTVFTTRSNISLVQQNAASL